MCIKIPLCLPRCTVRQKTVRAMERRAGRWVKTRVGYALSFSFLDSISTQNSKKATTVASTNPVPSSTPAFSSPVTPDAMVKGNGTLLHSPPSRFSVPKEGVGDRTHAHSLPNLPEKKQRISIPWVLGAPHPTMPQPRMLKLPLRSGGGQHSDYADVLFDTQVLVMARGSPF